MVRVVNDLHSDLDRVDKAKMVEEVLRRTNWSRLRKHVKNISALCSICYHTLFSFTKYVHQCTQKRVGLDIAGPLPSTS